MFRTPIGIVGNLASDVELEQTGKGIDRARFRIATSERYRDEQGQWRDSEAVFHQVTAWGQTARAVAQTFQKGDRVAVIGTATTEAWTNQDGKRQQSTQIRADTVAADPLFRGVQIDRSSDVDRSVQRDAPAVAAWREYEQSLPTDPQGASAQGGFGPSFGMQR